MVLSRPELVTHYNLSDLHVTNWIFLKRLYTEMPLYICNNDLNCIIYTLKIWALRRAYQLFSLKTKETNRFYFWIVMVLNYFWLTNKIVCYFQVPDYIIVHWRKVTNGYLCGPDWHCRIQLCLLMSSEPGSFSRVSRSINGTKSEVLLKP